VKLDWTPLAISHLRSTHQHIARDNPAAAEKIIGRILDAAERLADYPSMGRPGRIEGTRELVITGTPFIVTYRIRRNDLQILAVMHTSRKWPEEL
jgi:addiction module RelE/StbE family toxin